MSVAACSDDDASPASTGSAGSTTASAAPVTDASTAGTGTATDPAATAAPGDSSTTVPAVDPARATAALTALNLADRTTVGALDLIRDEPATVDAAVALLADTGATADQRWAAVYVLANATGHAEALVPVLADADPTLRTIAAIGVVGQGDERGFRVLVASLGDETFARGIEPNTQVWELATNALVRSTGLTFGPAFDADPADRLAAQARWTAWLDEHEAALTFDPTTEEWAA